MRRIGYVQGRTTHLRHVSRTVREEMKVAELKGARGLMRLLRKRTLAHGLSMPYYSSKDLKW